MEFAPLFTGRLAAPEPGDAEAFARWTQDDGYLRGFDNDPARPISPQAYAEWEQPFLGQPNSFIFRLRTLHEDRLIGMGILGDIQWTHRIAMLGITIGELEFRGRGYGSDAIGLLLGYAFRELNLERVWLHTLGLSPAPPAPAAAGAADRACLLSRQDEARDG